MTWLSCSAVLLTQCGGILHWDGARRGAVSSSLSSAQPSLDSGWESGCDFERGLSQTDGSPTQGGKNPAGYSSPGVALESFLNTSVSPDETEDKGWRWAGPR